MAINDTEITFATKEERALAFPGIFVPLNLRGLNLAWEGTVAYREDMRRKRPYQVYPVAREVHLRIGTHRGPAFNVWGEETPIEIAKVRTFAVNLGCTPEEVNYAVHAYTKLLVALANQITTHAAPVTPVTPTPAHQEG